MNGFEQLLMDFKGMSQSKAQQGALFERLMKKYFLTCPLYTEMFESVWTWVEFPYNGGKHDTGIDLVAKKKDFEEYYAIQCKFYDENNQVSKPDVDTFFSVPWMMKKSTAPNFIASAFLNPWLWGCCRIIRSSCWRWMKTMSAVLCKI